MCGIFGIIHIKEEKPFDYSTFCTLGIDNDARGGDSVGLFIDGQSEYYCEGANRSMFEHFIESSKLLQSTNNSKVAFGHCRKASVGSIKLTTAQPVVLSKDGKVEFVLMHNGTIYNAKELANEYIPEIDIADLTDSQIMARIFYHAGYEALGKYNGAAVFAIIDYRGDKPKYMFWQGESKLWSTSVKSELERPLFFAFGEDELVFSSIAKFLPVMRRNSKQLVPVPNMLIEYSEDGFDCIEEYDRSKCQQKEIYQSRTTTPTTVNTRPYTPTTTPGTNLNLPTRPVAKEPETSSNAPSGTTTSLDVANQNTYIIGSTYDGKCRINRKYVHGCFYVNDWGHVYKDKNADCYDMWFWNGTLLKNKEAFLYLANFAHDLQCTPEEVWEWYQELVLYLSPYPYMKTKEHNSTVCYTVDGPLSNDRTSGNVIFPFVHTAYVYKDGFFQSGTSIDMSMAIQPFKEHMHDVLDLEVLLEFN